MEGYKPERIVHEALRPLRVHPSFGVKLLSIIAPKILPLLNRDGGDQDLVAFVRDVQWAGTSWNCAGILGCSDVGGDGREESERFVQDGAYCMMS